jgi:UDP-N-acetylglucosamine--N-acetylmuramyl-(pentapeptide) pyrophosphoryl-undecaprenol N-acetylglucosamine transferase
MTKFIISGGGTGGHVFPAIAIANALRKKRPGADILFVGAKGKLEMEKVPAAGYPIRGLWISGFHRSFTPRNLLFPLKLLLSTLKAARIIDRFCPSVVIGVGGYASGPTLNEAARKKIPTLIQEQNSYPGITNRLLSKKVNTICVAYEGMERFFPEEKLVMTGNPVRQDLFSHPERKNEADEHFGLAPGKTTVLLLGGSLGARTINRAALRCLDEKITGTGIQLLWQTGRMYYESILHDHRAANNRDVHIMPFINRMDLAFAAADIIVSRAGAIAISELCIAGKPAILIPSPNVAEDHQARNATALEQKKAVLMIRDAEAEEKLPQALKNLSSDETLRQSLSAEIRKLAITDAADRIADEIIKLVPPVL